jgi:uncharacterized membrane protein
MFGFRKFVRIGRLMPGTSLLPVPFAIAAFVLMLLAFTLWLDVLANSGRIKYYAWVSVGGIDDARAILGAILGAVSTVLALIFSATLLVFSMAVSQFGPRLMHFFLRDRSMQIALGLFLAAFLHSLIALVATGEHRNFLFVPQLTAITSVALVFVSFCYLVVYNHRIALAIQTNNVLARIVEDLNQTIANLLEARVVKIQADAQYRLDSPISSPEDNSESVRLSCRSEGAPLRATTSGYVQRIELGQIVRAADKCGATVSLTFRPGEFALEGEPLAYILPRPLAAKLEAVICEGVKIGGQRTIEQDVEFAFAQLSEIALRALSPAINDIYTALSCIDWLGDALRLFAAVPSSDGAWRTRDGRIRVVLPPLRFEHVVRAGFDLIRQSSTQNPAISLRLMNTFVRLGAQLDDDLQRRAILHQVEAVREEATRVGGAPLDARMLDEAYKNARARLGAG